MNCWQKDDNKWQRGNGKMNNSQVVNCFYYGNCFDKHNYLLKYVKIVHNTDAKIHTYNVYGF